MVSKKGAATLLFYGWCNALSARGKIIKYACIITIIKAVHDDTM